MNTLIMTMGLPRSGKSTWANKQSYPMVNPDAIRLALYGQPFIANGEIMVWAIAKYMVRALFLAGHKTVILDATNTTKKRRDEWVDDSWEIKYKVFNTSEKICIKRARSIKREDLVEVIKYMTISWNTEGITSENLWKE